MRRMLLVFAVMVVMAAMLVAMAMPAFAAGTPSSSPTPEAGCPSGSGSGFTQGTINLDPQAVGTPSTSVNNDNQVCNKTLANAPAPLIAKFAPDSGTVVLSTDNVVK